MPCFDGCVRQMGSGIGVFFFQVRAPGWQGKIFHRIRKPRQIIIGGLFSVILFILLLGINGFSLFLVSVLAVLAAINYIKKRIGGMTGILSAP